MKKYIFWGAFCIVLFTVLFFLYLQKSEPKEESSVHEDLSLEEVYKKTPLAFQENQGQTDDNVFYFAKSGLTTIFLTKSQVVFALEGGVIRQSFIETSQNVLVTANKELQAKANYFIGDDPDEWKKNIPLFSEVIYKDLYPGIDLTLYGDGGGLRYKYLVQANADVSSILTSFEGIDEVVVGPSGEIIITSSFQNLGMRAPKAYYQNEKEHIPVEVELVLIDKKTFGYRLKEQRELPLIILQ